MFHVHSSRLMQPCSRQVILMAKSPGPQAKTRLQTRLSEQARGRLVAAMLRDTLQTLLSLAPELPGLSVRLACAPHPETPELQTLRTWLAPHDTTTTLRLYWSEQRGVSLGERLRTALHEALAQGAGQVLFIGSDSPTLPASTLLQAFFALETHEIVLGPAFDGGYYLLGLHADLPAALDHIPWSTPEVLAHTCQQARQAGHSLALLPFWYDVDEPTDLDFLMRHLQALRAAGDQTSGQETEALLKALAAESPPRSLYPTGA